MQYQLRKVIQVVLVDHLAITSREHNYCLPYCKLNAQNSHRTCAWIAIVNSTTRYTVY